MRAFRSEVNRACVLQLKLLELDLSRVESTRLAFTGTYHVHFRGSNDSINLNIERNRND
jgi:hypothetical protein